ncbi:MAG: DNA repair protein RadC [Nitrosomonadales bacterium]|nr:DNA repair protein RadC [Nitrosomonadales bacterium]
MATAIIDTPARDSTSKQNPSAMTAREERAIYRAMGILETHLRRAPSEVLNSSSQVRKFLTLKLAREESEQFVVLFLDTQHRLIEAETLFYGTLGQASVYPREVVKRALYHNAAAVILAHNHPSGVAEPSQSDQLLTCALKQALSLVDVRILDHFIVASDCALSLEEQGLMYGNPKLESEVEKRERRKALARKIRKPRLQTKAARARAGRVSMATHV